MLLLHYQVSFFKSSDNRQGLRWNIYLARDDLIVNWNDTQSFFTRKQPKRAYYLSLEWLMGRTLDNALLNLRTKNEYKQSISKLGFVSPPFLLVL